MSAIIDTHGNHHHPAGTTGAGQFAPRTRPAPAAPLQDPADDYFDEREWQQRMESIIDDGEPTPVDPALEDPDAWDTPPF